MVVLNMKSKPCFVSTCFVISVVKKDLIAKLNLFKMDAACLLAPEEFKGGLDL